MSKSVFEPKWHRSTLWAYKNRLIELESEFLSDQGWQQGTIANLGLSSGLVCWFKTINGIQCMCDKDSALRIAHAELFDKGPSIAAVSSPPMEPPHDPAKPTQEESEPAGQPPVARGTGGRYG